MKVISLITLTDEGHKRAPEAVELFAKSVEVVEAVGGKLIEVYAVDGHYDFVSIAEYPTEDAVFEARVKLLELGIFTAENMPAFEMDRFFAVV